jgi:hypothetical protein
VPTGALHLRLAKTAPPPKDDPALSRRRGLAGLIIGKDGRASTSRFGVVLWTFAVFYALAFMLVLGRSSNCDDAKYRDGPRCTAAHDDRARLSDSFTNRDVQPAYLVLLGFPVAAAVAAQAITGARKRADPDAKPSIEEDRRGILQATRELTGDDDGSTNLLESQYLAFNVLTMVYFLVEFLGRPVGGLPDLPPTLLTLAGVSASAYTTNKALADLPANDDEPPERASPPARSVAKKAATRGGGR